MKILVACEESQAVTIELRKLGHEAYSCDILPCGGGHPEWHIQNDVSMLLKRSTNDRQFKVQSGAYEILPKEGWDLIIAFPPCTHISNSGARHFEKKRLDGRQRDAIEFFMLFENLDCDKVAIENPMNIIGGEYIRKHFPDLCEKYNFRKKTQTIQPWMFGDEAQKTTNLWLKGLPELKPTDVVGKGEFYTAPSGKKLPKWYNHNTNNKADRQKSRSVTFPGIAKAMAEQWTKETNQESDQPQYKNYSGYEQQTLF